MILYENPISPYVQKVKIALYEKGLEFESRLPNLFGALDEEFLRTSPRREIPTLVDDDATLFDSTIILEYLEEKYPSPALMPESPAARARARMIEDVCDTSLEAILWGLAEIKFFGRGKGGLGEQLQKRAAEQLAGAYAYLERHMGEGAFFDGEIFGRTDLSVFPHVGAAFLYGLGPSDGTRLATWFGAAMSRASTQKTMAAARAAMQALPDLPGLVEAGALVRQYRDHRLDWMMRSGGAQIVLDGVEKKNLRFSAEIV
jgi:glutathione S-transferase